MCIRDSILTVFHGRIHGEFLACCLSVPTTRLSFTSGLWMRPSMLTRKPTVGGGAGSSGACGPPLAWHVLRPLPWPRRFLEKAIRGPEPGAQVFEPLHLTPDLRAPTGRPSTFSFVFLCLSVCEPRSYGHFPSPTPSMSHRGIFNKTHLLSLTIINIIIRVFSIKPTFSHQ